MTEPACKGQPIELFFGPAPGKKGGGRATELALKKGKEVCKRCPVKAECYQTAKEWEGGTWGVWGGVVWRDGVPDE